MDHKTIKELLNTPWRTNPEAQRKLFIEAPSIISYLLKENEELREQEKRLITTMGTMSVDDSSKTDRLEKQNSIMREALEYFDCFPKATEALEKCKKMEE